MIHDTIVQGDSQRTTLTCDNAECGHGFVFSTGVDQEIVHTDELVRTAAADNHSWGQTQSQLDLCPNCLPDWTPALGDAIKKRRPPPNKIHYGNGVFGWSHRALGPTKTGTGDDVV